MALAQLATPHRLFRGRSCTRSSFTSSIAGSLLIASCLSSVYGRHAALAIAFGSKDASAIASDNEVRIDMGTFFVGWQLWEDLTFVGIPDFLFCTIAAASNLPPRHCRSSRAAL